MSDLSYINCPKCNMKYHVKAVACPQCKITPEQYSEQQAKEAERQEKLAAKKAERLEKHTAQLAESARKGESKRLKSCKDCGHEVSTKAKACPNCGAQIKKTSGCAIVFAGLMLLSFIFAISGNDSTKDEPRQTNIKKAAPEKTPEQIKAEEAAIKAEEAACRQDLSCWAEKKFVEATVKCPRHIEKLAKYSHEWTDGLLDFKFTHYRWKDKERGVVTYLGDKIKFQNGFGAWQMMVYECDIDTETDTVLGVNAQSGQL